MRTAKARRGRFARNRQIIYEAPRVGGALIDEHLTRNDFRDACQVVLFASPEETYEAVRHCEVLSEYLTMFGPFAVLAERPGREIVFGAVAKPWRADEAPPRITASAFSRFSEPGFAKIAWSWIVKPLGSGQTLLIAEWRMALTNDEARARIKEYWSVVGPQVRVEAQAALARIKDACEQEIGTAVGGAR